MKIKSASHSVDEEELSYEEDLKIDIDQLDVEWLRQPSLYMKYSVLVADVNRRVDYLEERLDVVKAGLDRAIRSNPKKYKLADKPTEGGIKAAILQQEEYQLAFKKWLDAKHKKDLYTGALWSMNHRKEALENLVRLHGQNYFAGPETPRATNDLTDKINEGRKKAVRRVIASKLNKD